MERLLEIIDVFIDGDAKEKKDTRNTTVQLRICAVSLLVMIDWY